VAQYEEAVAAVREGQADQDVHDFLSTPIYRMTGQLLMALILVGDASKAPELFAKSAAVYTDLVEAECQADYTMVMNFTAEKLDNYRHA